MDVSHEADINRVSNIPPLQVSAPQSRVTLSVAPCVNNDNMSSPRDDDLNNDNAFLLTRASFSDNNGINNDYPALQHDNNLSNDNISFPHLNTSFRVNNDNMSSPRNDDLNNDNAFLLTQASFSDDDGINNDASDDDNTSFIHFSASLSADDDINDDNAALYGNDSDSTSYFNASLSRDRSGAECSDDEIISKMANDLQRNCMREKESHQSYCSLCNMESTDQKYCTGSIGNPHVKKTLHRRCNKCRNYVHYNAFFRHSSTCGGQNTSVEREENADQGLQGGNIQSKQKKARKKKTEQLSKTSRQTARNRYTKMNKVLDDINGGNIIGGLVLLFTKEPELLIKVMEQMLTNPRFKSMYKSKLKDESETPCVSAAKAA